MKTKLIALLMMITMVLGSACSTMDPSDEDKVAAAIGYLSSDQQAQLRTLAGLHDACDEMLKWANSFNNLDDFTYQTEWDCNEPGVHTTAGNANLNEWCRSWDGSGLFVDHMKSMMKTESNQDCAPNPRLAEKFQEVHDKVKNAPTNERVIQLLLVGAIAVGVLTVIAPELLPVLCSLGVDSYCPDTSGSGGGSSGSSSSSGVPAGDAP